MSKQTQSNHTHDDVAISVQGLSKAYRIWRDPGARLKAPLWDTLGSILPNALRPKALKERLSHEGTSRYYTDFYALDKLDIEIKKGEAVGIIGRNGSGKSTLLQMIAGTLTPTTGTIQVNGRVAALLELGSGFNPEFTGRENVYLNGAVLGFNTEQIDAKIDQIIEFADIGEFVEQPVKTYSSGMIVRLAFAVQSIIEPDILIVDEALSVGDEAFQRKCFSKIEALRQNGTTLLFVSHDCGVVTQLCNRAILLTKGKVTQIGAPKDVVKAYQRMIYNPENCDTALENPQEQDPDKAPQQILAHDDYDPNLMSQSIEHYDKGYCRFTSFEILTDENVKTNVLSSGSTYTLRYQVEFMMQCFGVRYGASLKTISGLVISGAIFNTEKFESAQIGSTQTVEFKLNCLLAPGVYFINMGVFHMRGDAEEFAGRIVDGIMFRVSDDSSRSHQTEIIDLLTPKLK